MIALTDQQLQDFQNAVQWRTGYELPDGRLLGVPGKRGNVARGFDPRVQAVRDHFDPHGKRILEIGCCEGGHTVQLATICAEVVGIDVRPHNIVAALVRSFVHGTKNVRFELSDVRELGAEHDAFDIVFHVGVLYHLDDPASHLARIAALAPDLLLDTHYADDSLPWPTTDSKRGGRTYAARLYREGSWDDVFSGVQPTSAWLTREDLFRCLRDIGYTTVTLLDDRKERNGPRLTLIARRPAAGNEETLQSRLMEVEAQLAALRAA